MFIGIYNTLITVLYPLVIRSYIQKRIEIGKEDIKRFNERIGKPIKERPEGKLIWFHGASVGESVSMLPLINRLLETSDDTYVMVTTGTTTSAEIMGKRLPERAFHQYITIDNPVFTKRFIKHWQPDLVLWFESDFWPAMLSTIKKKNIPLVLVNGRISNKSFKRWQQFDYISKELLGCFTFCLGQSEEDAYRLRILGAKESTCLGNLKFAGLPIPVDEDKKAEVIKQIGNRRIFCISSTHENEEYQLGKRFKLLFEKHPDVLVLIAPRHPQRGGDIKKQLSDLGLNVALRSANEKITDKTQVYIADTIGELGIWYGISPVVFIGGSLIPHGGQNFMEPSRLKDAVIVGPYMHNFTEAMQRAQKANAIIQTNDAEEVIDTVIQLFDNKDLLEAKQSLAYNWASGEAKVLDGIVEKVKGYIA
ncbi:MAG: 3-deoxy-D-manno-octulosonic acid transferase [Alphaproteobacteria bacterium]|nr:3-deoxy-D-manno-octulosonic acid transferase [Alphaproteobacteria bacterium]